MNHYLYSALVLSILYLDTGTEIFPVLLGKVSHLGALFYEDFLEERRCLMFSEIPRPQAMKAYENINLVTIEWIID